MMIRMKKKHQTPVIYFLTRSRFPSVRAESFTTIYTSEALARRSCSVHLFFSGRKMTVDPITTSFQNERAFDFYGIHRNDRNKLDSRLHVHKVPSLDFLLRDGIFLKLYWALYNLTLSLQVVVRILLGERPHVIYTRTQSLALLFVLLRPLLKVPVVYEVHQVRFPSLSEREKIVFKAVDGLAVLTRSIERLLIERGVASTKICYAALGVRLKDFVAYSKENREDVRRRLGLPSNDYLVTYVGSFYKDKGVDLLLKAFKLLKGKVGLRRKVKLVLIGGFQEEEDYNRILKLTRQLGGEEHVIFKGYVPPYMVHEYLFATDLAIYTPKRTKYHEFCSSGGLKLCQYMAARKPVIISRLESTKEIVKHGTDGWLVEPTPPSIAWAIRYLFHNPRLCAKIASSAFRKISQEFTWDKRALRLYMFFQKRGFI